MSLKVGDTVRLKAVGYRGVIGALGTYTTKVRCDWPWGSYGWHALDEIELVDFDHDAEVKRIGASVRVENMRTSVAVSSPVYVKGE